MRRSAAAPSAGLLAAIAMAVVAVCIRLPHLGWGLPDIEEEALPLKKAFAMWGWRDGRLTLDPETAGWPSLSFYAHLLLQHLIYWTGRAGGVFADRLDFYLLQRDFTPLVVAGRALGVAAAGGVVLIAVRLGERLTRPLTGGGWAPVLAGVLAGGALAASPLLYAESRLVAPDILLTLLAALAMLRLVDVLERGRLRDHVWAGIWIGLGASAKYSPVLLVPVLLLAHLMRRRREGCGRILPGDRRLLWAAVACALAFVLTSPYLLLDPGVFERDLAAQFSHLGGGHFGHEGRGGLSLYYVRDVLAPALGWPGLFLALTGLAYAAWRRRGPWLVMAAGVLCLYLGLGFLQTKFDRYMLPLLLPLALGLAAAAAWLLGRLAGRPVVLKAAAAAALLLAVLGPPAAATLQLARGQALPGTLHLARRFILEQLDDPDLVFAMEHYTPELPLDRRAEFEAQDAFRRLDAPRRDLLLGERAFDVFYVPMYAIAVEMSAFYYDLRHFLPADVIVTSGAVRARYERSADRFPRQAAFYRDLERYAELLAVFGPGSAARGPEIRIHRLTDAGRDRLLRDRGELAPDFHHEFLPDLHRPHFHAFLRDVAWRAYGKRMYGLADLYYRALWETSPPGPERVFQSPHVVAVMQLGRLDEARRMCEAELAQDPQNLQALALLGLALQTAGETDQAVEAYRRCIALGRTVPAEERAPQVGVFFDAAQWAQRQLELLLSRTGD